MSATAEMSLRHARAWPPEPRSDVALACAEGERAELEPLLNALESAIPVCFVRPDTSDSSSLCGLISVGSQQGSPAGFERAPAAAPLPRLVLPARQPWAERAHPPSSSTIVTLSSELELPRALRGRAIRETSRPGRLPIEDQGRTRVLASVEGRPVWSARVRESAEVFASAYALPSLGPSGSLREHFRAERFMGLLPLLRFLERVLGVQRWRLPAARAAFVVDDPNLHWSSYGFLRYIELAAHARDHGYHLALATVPLDGWHVDRRAAALIRANAASLSLAIHGNDHVADEMGRLARQQHAEAAVAQAVRRVRGQERRARLPIDRVIVPPHSACSEASLRAMFRLGLDGACVNRPYPWRDEMPPASPLAGWHPAELVAGGIAVLPRRRLDESREELIFRALLGQPLVLYGHHGDFAAGLGVLEQAAEEVRRIAGPRWGSLGSLAAGCCATRRVGETLLVRMYARRSAIAVPAGVRTLEVQFPSPLGGAAWHRLAHSGGVAEVDFRGAWGLSAPIPCEPRGEVELAVIPDSPLSPRSVPAPRPRLWPLVRRLASEGRDRAQPLLRGTAGSKAVRPADRSMHDGIAGANGR